MEFIVEEVEVKNDAEPESDAQGCPILQNEDKKQSRDLDENVETIDPYFKFKLLVEELLVIFRNREDKCGVCVEYIVKLCQHIGDTHDNGHEHDTDDVINSSDLIRHPNSCHSESTCIPVQTINSEEASTSSTSSNTYVTSKATKNTIGAEQFTDDNSSQNIRTNHEDVDEGGIEKSCTSPSNTPSTIMNSNSCGFCGKAFPNRHLDTHLLTHTGEKPFECETCGKCFTTKQTLKNHNRVHTGERPYRCDICDKSFRYSGNLRHHKLLVKCNRNKSNDNRKVIINLHKCLRCGKIFRNRYALSAHGKVHGGGKKDRFYCGVCGKGFFYNYSLVKHQSTHTGEKPFRCDDCGKCFAKPFNLKTHKRTHTGEKPFHCDECGKYFTQLSSLKYHKKINTCKGMKSMEYNNRVPCSTPPS